jgi:hypothetical protein
MLTRRFTFLFFASALLAACAPGPAPATIEPTATAAPAVVSTLPVQPTLEAGTTPGQGAANGAWVQYRDPRYGIGLAYPCWWIMYPMPADGSGATLSLRSFDEDYSRAHTVRGEWPDGIAPEGVFTADLVVFEDVDPAKSNAEAYPIDPSATAIASSEEELIGQNQATVIQLKDLVNTNAPLFTMVLFRLAPDKLLGFVTQQQDQLDSVDLQGILTSLSLSPDQPITLPTGAPHEPLIAAGCLSR